MEQSNSLFHSLHCGPDSRADSHQQHKDDDRAHSLPTPNSDQTTSGHLNPRSERASSHVAASFGPEYHPNIAVGHFTSAADAERPDLLGIGSQFAHICITPCQPCLQHKPSTATSGNETTICLCYDCMPQAHCHFLDSRKGLDPVGRYLEEGTLAVFNRSVTKVPVNTGSVPSNDDVEDVAEMRERRRKREGKDGCRKD